MTDHTVDSGSTALRFGDNQNFDEILATVIGQLAAAFDGQCDPELNAVLYAALGPDYVTSQAETPEPPKTVTEHLYRRYEENSREGGDFYWAAAAGISVEVLHDIDFRRLPTGHEVEAWAWKLKALRSDGDEGTDKARPGRLTAIYEHLLNESMNGQDWPRRDTWNICAKRGDRSGLWHLGVGTEDTIRNALWLMDGDNRRIHIDPADPTPYGGTQRWLRLARYHAPTAVVSAASVREDRPVIAFLLDTNGHPAAALIPTTTLSKS
ncbi:hypothetical protein [Nocardioides pinisoli]|uniref:Uncharacterized protein n=1 Tax=Nocardioides pinisoli TaxID=2950279 RepID=A0ABT1KRF8_9ACTN|nr:hypothetical protein [Nocardioides pinisoli]MCP3420328.1 hypothetical protein [Nocardioides pinisoli]